MRYDQSSAALWGGGDRCPFSKPGLSKLVPIPSDHPPINTPQTNNKVLLSPGQTPIETLKVDSHHHLPRTIDLLSPIPILYLPPLLSPLPGHIPHHAHTPSEEELSSFNTHLPDIDPASLALHQVLHHFHPIDSHYAAREYSDAFNWGELGLGEEIEREWYCVVFRSRRNKESESLSLYQADREAHEEAVRNGGLVMYWYGVPDETGLNLATCIWQSRRHAIKAISGPKHLLAMKHAANAYEVYDLERWILRKVKGDKSLGLEKWQGGDVGW